MSDADKSAVSNDSTGLSDSILKDLLPTDIRADLEGDFEGCARLDDAAIRSLNVFSEKSNLNKTQVRSLFDVLGQCCTKAGLRTLDQWLRNPLVDLIRLTVRQELVQFFVDDSGIRWDMSKEHLIKVISLPMKDYANKLKARQLSLRKCCDLFLAIRNLKPLMLKLKKHSEASDVDPENEGCAAEHLRERVRRCYTNPLALYTRMLSNFIKVMDKAIDPESLDSGDPLISHTVDADLEHLHDQMSALRKEAQKALVKVADLIDADPNKEVRLQCDNEIGFLYRTSRRVDDKLRSKSGLEVIATKKDGIRFTDSKLKQLNGRYLSLHADYEQAQKHKVDELMETLSSFWEVIARLADLLTHLDVIVGLAIAAESADGGVAPYVRPQLLPSADGILCLKQARHPVLERMANVYYMPNDIELNRAKRRFVILTGPNMGGKSTFMRSIGCCVILAQIGSFVPAEEATVSLLDGFLTRVGASDAQSLGESTFLTEMKDTAHLLVSAGPHSLVIIDELGRGTSTFDGYGLAKSISCELIEKNQCLCLFATHYHELSSLASEYPVALNLKVTFSKEESQGTVRMLYRVEEGVCDERFGLQVARLVHFPPEVLQDAENQMSELEEALGHKVTDMDAMMNELLNEVTDFSEPTQKAIDQMIGSNEGNLRQRFASVLSEQ